MTKKHFVALADFIKERFGPSGQFNPAHVEALAGFLATQNPRFNRGRWIAYINGTCGPNGGKPK